MNSTVLKSLETNLGTAGRFPNAEYVPLQDDAAVQAYLAPYEQWREDPRVTEIAVNNDGRVWVYTNQWDSYNVPQINQHSLLSLGGAIATYTNSAQGWNAAYPILSGSLKDNSRIQLVMEPGVLRGHVSFTLRQPSRARISLKEMGEQGMFQGTTQSTFAIKPHEKELLSLVKSGKIIEFLTKAVQYRQNIVLSGATGSGKTTVMKALVDAIDPGERIITIEDAHELSLTQPNVVHLLYDNAKMRPGSDTPVLSAKDALLSCLRMKPDRILLAEMRGSECLYFLRAALSGHPGTLTSCHGENPAMAYEQMMMMVKSDPVGAGLDYNVIKRLIHLTVDIVVQIEVDRHTGQRRVVEIDYNPQRKYAIAQGKDHA
ncbi:type IV secretion system protein VirB11 [Nitrosomonas eutropha]|uniref:Type IV secretion system protein n=1 Tax=Nitrosomonas eutropha TaxID=916 RepID=A0A1I7FBE0_9PROT|nr:P-type DNA transfer ATPase VirB11 [Nitrosomonas eutropha]SFU33482.1 type IV secretion system protein VirB11 [Nitrosomonas eutropha]